MENTVNDVIVTDSPEFQIDPKNCLTDALEKKLKNVVVIGENEDGTHTVWSSCSYEGTTSIVSKGMYTIE